MRNRELFLNALEYNEKIVDELSPDPAYSCFQGAWYHKAVSSHDQWLGIEGIVTLPDFLPDENRSEEIKDVKFPNGTVKRFLDTPSVYVGGSSDYETDIGFGWFHGMIDGKISTEKVTFRPFWRTIFLEDGQIRNVYQGTPIEASEYYYFPGDQVKIQLICEEDHFLSLIVTLLKEIANPIYSQIRGKCHPNQRLYITHIKAPGSGIRPSTYKRVNAIDQYHNEGKPTQNTGAKALNSSWESVFLFRYVDGELVKVPFSRERFTRMMCPDPMAFEVKKTDNQELINIVPKNVLEGKKS